MTGQPNDFNGLGSTPVRRKVLDAVRVPGRIYREAGQVWDKVTGLKVTARVDEMLAAGWLRFATDEERLPVVEASAGRKFYRSTPLGERARMHGRETSRG